LIAVPLHHYESNAVFWFVFADFLVYASLVVFYPQFYASLNVPKSLPLNSYNNVNALVCNTMVVTAFGMLAGFKILRDKSARKTFVSVVGVRESERRRGVFHLMLHRLDR
jgi:hypothetical protein